MAINDRISARIQAFTVELEALVRASALDAVRRALGSAAPAKVAVVGSATRAAAPASNGAAAPKPRARRKGGKRSPAQLASLVTRTSEWINSHPGHGVEHMAKAMNVRTKDLALPITKLLGGGKIKKKGEKRATKYFAA